MRQITVGYLLSIFFHVLILLFFLESKKMTIPKKRYFPPVAIEYIEKKTTEPQRQYKSEINNKNIKSNVSIKDLKINILPQGDLNFADNGFENNQGRQFGSSSHIEFMNMSMAKALAIDSGLERLWSYIESRLEFPDTLAQINSHGVVKVELNINQEGKLSMPLRVIAADDQKLKFYIEWFLGELIKEGSRFPLKNITLGLSFNFLSHREFFENNYRHIKNDLAFVRKNPYPTNFQKYNIISLVPTPGGAAPMVDFIKLGYILYDEYQKFKTPNRDYILEVQEKLWQKKE